MARAHTLHASSIHQLPYSAVTPRNIPKEHTHNSSSYNDGHSLGRLPHIPEHMPCACTLTAQPPPQQAMPLPNKSHRLVSDACSEALGQFELILTHTTHSLSNEVISSCYCYGNLDVYRHDKHMLMASCRLEDVLHHGLLEPAGHCVKLSHFSTTQPPPQCAQVVTRLCFMQQEA